MEFLDTFLPALLGAFFGTGFAFGLSVAERRMQARRTERQAIDDLLDDLHFRRAFAPELPDRADASLSAVVDDLALVVRSVLKARDAVRETRRMLVPGSAASEPLRSMTAALNTYLERQQFSPENYRYFLQECREQLNSAIAAIAVTARVEAQFAGEGAFALRPFPTDDRPEPR